MAYLKEIINDDNGTNLVKYRRIICLKISAKQVAKKTPQNAWNMDFTRDFSRPEPQNAIILLNIVIADAAKDEDYGEITETVLGYNLTITNKDYANNEADVSEQLILDTLCNLVQQHNSAGDGEQVPITLKHGRNDVNGVIMIPIEKSDKYMILPVIGFVTRAAWG